MYSISQWEQMLKKKDWTIKESYPTSLPFEEWFLWNSSYHAFLRKFVKYLSDIESLSYKQLKIDFIKTIMLWKSKENVHKGTVGVVVKDCQVNI